MSEKHKSMNELISEVNLSGDTLSNANDFASFLEREGMLAGGEHGSITYNDNILCYMHIDGNNDIPGPWTIWSDGDYSEDTPNLTLNAEEKDIVWANINICGNCGAKCAPGKTKSVFGKSFNNVCSAPLQFCDPQGKTLECLKKILRAKKESFIQ